MNPPHDRNVRSHKSASWWFCSNVSWCSIIFWAHSGCDSDVRISETQKQNVNCDCGMWPHVPHVLFVLGQRWERSEIIWNKLKLNWSNLKFNSLILSLNFIELVWVWGLENSEEINPLEAESSWTAIGGWGAELLVLGSWPLAPLSLLDLFKARKDWKTSDADSETESLWQHVTEKERWRWIRDKFGDNVKIKSSNVIDYCAAVHVFTTTFHRNPQLCYGNLSQSPSTNQQSFHQEIFEETGNSRISNPDSNR